MMFILLRMFLLLLLPAFLNAFVPHSTLISDVSTEIFSSSRTDRHFFLHSAFGFADEKYGRGLAMQGSFQRFNLNDLAKSADIYSQEMGNGTYLPETLRLISRWQGKPIFFNTASAIRCQRASIVYSDFISIEDYANYFEDKSIKKRLIEGASVSFGVAFPFVQIQSSNQYELDKGRDSYFEIQEGDAAAESKAEQLRSELFKQIGLADNVWDHSGLGDIELYLGIKSHAEYYLRLRSMDLGMLVGLIFPTGMQKHHAYPASVPFGLSSVGLSIQSNIDMGLKDYLHVGLNAGLLVVQSKTLQLRVPVYEEPAAYSPLIAEMRVNPGLTLWLNPFITIKNIANDLHVTLNYSMVMHNEDESPVDSKQPLIRSVFSRNVDVSNGILESGRNEAIRKIKELSAWNSRTLGLTMTYEPYQTKHEMIFNPYFNIGFQYAHNGSNIPACHQLTASICLQF
jgi:hypothetical protein